MTLRVRPRTGSLHPTEPPPGPSVARGSRGAGHNRPAPRTVELPPRLGGWRDTSPGGPGRRHPGPGWAQGPGGGQEDTRSPPKAPRGPFARRTGR